MDEVGGRVILHQNGVTRAGCTDDNDVVLSDDRVSRHYAAITHDNGRFLIRALGSTNGTFVDEVRISEQGLSDGDLIRVGDTRFTFRII